MFDSKKISTRTGNVTTRLILHLLKRAASLKKEGTASIRLANAETGKKAKKGDLVILSNAASYPPTAFHTVTFRHH